MEAKYVVDCEAANEAIWLKKFLMDLGVMRIEQFPIIYIYIFFCVTIVEWLHNPRNHRREKHIECKYHLIREIISRRDVIITKISAAEIWHTRS
jgi:hypothetical protein